ncbi:MAG: carbon starvation protein A [Spirochaetaceae bacterium]|jgi:carbon starvation protein CstA|nr:carbon starvation protein A [Spirochaetaceae bacterium]
MISFLLGIAALIIGYLVYGKITEKIFSIKPERQTPAIRINDGVDFVPLPTWRATLIQFLNIAGTGPIFGAIAGALWGPAAFAWIVFGCIFAGAVHDYFCGMLSLRNDGASIAEIVGKYLGNKPRYIMRVFSVALLVFVGVVFVYTPAQVLNVLIDPDNKNIFTIALIVIILYYIFATILPIDKLIGNLYPIFGAALLVMGVGITITLFASGEIASMPEFEFKNLHPKGAAIFPFLFVSIACGAISGFHATQSPLMARCVKNETEGRKVFYGAMICEGVIAMIWAAAAMAHFGGQEGLAAAGSAASVVTKVSVDLMGAAGGALAVLGVVACPITSGDTAFRGARLSIADALKFDQKPIKNRFAISLPLFAIGIVMVIWSQKSAANFSIIWRYFAWSNQTLATIALWAASAYLAKTAKNYWITLIPATFMTVVVTSYIITAQEGFGPLISKLSGDPALSYNIGIAAGVILAVALFSLFVPLIGIKQKGVLKD